MNLECLIKLRSYREWLLTLPVLVLLLSVIVAGNAGLIHARLLDIGELIWHDYFTLRADMPTPDCNPNPDFDTLLKKLEAESADSSGMADLFDASPFDRNAALVSLQAARKLCIEKHKVAAQNQARVTIAVDAFRTLETSVAKFSLYALEKQRVILLLTIFICAISCSLNQHHIAFRPIITQQEHYISTLAQLLGNSIMLFSAWFYRQALYASASAVVHPEVQLLLVIGFACLIAVNLFQLLKPYVSSVTLRRENSIIPESDLSFDPTTTSETQLRSQLYASFPSATVKPKSCAILSDISKLSFLKSLLTIPLYIFMSYFVAGYFFLLEAHWAGPAIFFSLLFDQAGLFLNIGLYIWVGMLLKRTQLGDLVFKVFIPWKMSAELLAFVAIIVMAVPTAYTGASGIIIIAMGSIVYEELRRVGARRQLALAATAMTGSAGVVLRPCLLVVLIAALNKEVVTDQLFNWGLKVFMTTAVVFFIFAWLSKREKMHIAPVQQAYKPFLLALVPLIPYAGIVLFIYFSYYLMLGVKMDEFSAPVILPVIILALIIYEKVFVKMVQVAASEPEGHKFEYSVRMASSESSVHIGALLMLMGLSFALGGVIERSGLLTHIPDTFSSIWLTLSFLIVVLVGIGMVMDPFGAVVLVSGTIAQIAYNNGINPVHFWMITLVAFELGYLTPPVALNHLLTRQMVGHKETAIAALEGDSFWYRHEKILLPLVTMGTTLLLVTIVPVVFKY